MTVFFYKLEEVESPWRYVSRVQGKIACFVEIQQHLEETPHLEGVVTKGSNPLFRSVGSTISLHLSVSEGHDIGLICQ